MEGRLGSNKQHINGTPFNATSRQTLNATLDHFPTHRMEAELNSQRRPQHLEKTQSNPPLSRGESECVRIVREGFYL
jgi:hypothetical protein